MAKMFYTMDEARTALGKNEEEIKQLTREGRLREFRDGPRLMFKADQVEQLKAEIGGGAGGNIDQIDLGPSDSGAPIGLAGSSLTGSGSGSGTGTGAGITLSDDTMPSGGGKGDSALAADLGLSGSLGGVPSPGARGSGGSGSGSGLSGSRAGVSVFTADEVEGVDPSAQTAISAGVTDQVNLEGVGSGSGLLDLTRESDDTSLGAELLDEIQPGAGGQRRAAPSDTAVAPGIEMEEPRGGVVRTAVGAQYVEAFDSASPAFGGAALGVALVTLFGLFVLISAVVGTWPPIVQTLGQKFNLLTIAGIGIAVAVVLFVLGMVFGKKR